MFSARRFTWMLVLWTISVARIVAGAEATRTMPFRATTADEARKWQAAAREKLLGLMMGGRVPPRGPLDPQRLRRIEAPGRDYVLEELTLQTLADRRAHVWLARPRVAQRKVGAVLAIHGHGGSGEEVVRGLSLYWYGRALIDMGYVVIAPDVGQHTLQNADWSLMGERTWDCLRCLDYVASLPEVDSQRLAVAGLSLGGETAMYVSALDERVKITCSSGWLTSVQNMKQGHCTCFDFPGLEQHFDYSDIFACVAPRTLVCELGELERAPGGFPLSIGRQVLEEIRGSYRVLGAETELTLTAHPGPHVFAGRDFLPKVRQVLGDNVRPLPDNLATTAWVRFDDGPEALDGTPYYWLGRTSLRLEFNVRPQSGDTLELSWGGKSDHREAQLVVNGTPVTVRDGGHWGFRWIRVPVPPGVSGQRYEISLQRGEGLPAFLGEVRLTSARQVDHVDLAAASGRATFSAQPIAAAPPLEAFAGQRAAWDRETPLPDWIGSDDKVAQAFREAEKNSRLANESLFRCRKFVDGWLAQADPVSGLIPRNLTASRDFWNGRDAAADNYPFMVLTAALTDRPLLDGRMRDMLSTETRLTSRLDRLPDDYSFSTRSWRRETLDRDAITFDAAEYVKDGLLPITEWMGPSPWSDRMLGIVDDIWKHASVESPSGVIPTANVEVCGDLLQANSRLYWLTGDRKYLDWAIRLGDYFLLGSNHPTRDWKQLRLSDHGCEVINGLTELYVAVAHADPAKREAYRGPLHELFDCILDKGRSADGLLYASFDPQSGAHSAELCDTWGYDFDGFYSLWLLDGTAAYRDAVVKALNNLQGKHVGACWGDTSADGFADSIEGAINLLNREPVESAREWTDSQIRQMWGIQKSDGIIEGWHGDGNFARTSLMYALWKSQGVTVHPWRPDVRLGAARGETALCLCVAADAPWEGRLVFDRPRHKQVMHLPLDYPRINQFPEWFVAHAEKPYAVRIDQGSGITESGKRLTEGLTLKLPRGGVTWITVQEQ